MTAPERIRRFTTADRLFHLAVMLTFMFQTLTGLARLYYATPWGKFLLGLFGGYESATRLHGWVGMLMIAGFLVHIGYALYEMRGKGWFGPDSMIPNLQDFRQMGQAWRWFLGLGPPPRYDRWTYFEKFDYWAVFWGMPLFALTGLMLMYPIAASRLLPGWFLNVALLLHRAEALLAIGYLFLVHILVGHLRRHAFPMNEGMFSGSVVLAHEGEEKPVWIERLKQEGRLGELAAAPPAPWFRALYLGFGFVMVALALYLLIQIIRFWSLASWH